MQQIQEFAPNQFWYTNNRGENFVHVTNNNMKGLFGLSTNATMGNGEFVQVNTPIKLDRIVLSESNNVLLAYDTEDSKHRIYFSNNCNNFPNDYISFQLLTTVKDTIEEIKNVPDNEGPEVYSEYFLIKMSKSVIVLEVSVTVLYSIVQGTAKTKYDKLLSTYTYNNISLSCFTFNNNVYLSEILNAIWRGHDSFSTYTPFMNNVKDVVYCSPRGFLAEDQQHYYIYLVLLNTSGSLDAYIIKIDSKAVIETYFMDEDISVVKSFHLADGIQKILSGQYQGNKAYVLDDKTILTGRINFVANGEGVEDNEVTLTNTETLTATSTDNAFACAFGYCEKLSDTSFKLLKEPTQKNLLISSGFLNQNTMTLQFPEAPVDFPLPSNGIFRTQNQIFAFNRLALTQTSALTGLRVITAINGSYSASALNRTLQEFKTCLPSDLAAVISPVSKTTTKIKARIDVASYQKVMGAEAEANNYDIFTFSEGEVFGKSKNTIEGGSQVQYAYYKNSGVSLRRVAHNDEDKPVTWWTSTANLGTDGAVSSTYISTEDAVVSATKPYYSDQRISRGIVPLFAIKG